MYDIAIIGGGPAGATLARLLGGRYRILLLERRVFGEGQLGGQRKCCGGLLDPDAQKMLASFGLGLPASVLVSPQMFAVRTIDMDNRRERYYQRHYVNVDREEFDRWTLSLAPAGVEVVQGALYRSHEEAQDHVTVRFIDGGVHREERAKLLVGADGAFSGVRRRLTGCPPQPARYAAIQEWFENIEDINYYGAIFDSSITDFYSWIIPKGKDIVVGAALSPGADTTGTFERLKRTLRSYGLRFGASVLRNGTWLYRPRSVGQLALGKGRVCLVGEAAGFISPSSAEGFSYAFRSAEALSDALTAGMDGWLPAYRRAASALRMDICLKLLKSPFMYDKALRGMVMKSGLMSIRVKS